MRIALARRGYSSTGGAENYLCRLAAGLEAAGHECTLLTGPDWPRERWPGTGFHRTGRARSPRAFADFVNGMARPGADNPYDRLFSLERLWGCDCYRAGDGVHLAWMARRARAAPAWKTFLRRWNPKHQQIIALEKSLFAGRGAGRVIANSALVRDEIVDCYGYPTEQIAIVHNGLPAEYFAAATDWQTPGRRAAARSALGLREDDAALLFAGSGWERKGLHAALAALEILVEEKAAPTPLLLVAGRGNPRKYLAGISPRTRARVRFLGPVKDMPACYAAADLFVLPTLYDPFSNACLEALAAGLPVVTTRGNGFGEIIVRGEHGDVLDEQAADFHAALAHSLMGWLDPGRRRSAGASCAQRAAGHTLSDNVERTLALLLPAL